MSVSNVRNIVQIFEIYDLQPYFQALLRLWRNYDVFKFFIFIFIGTIGGGEIVLESSLYKDQH